MKTITGCLAILLGGVGVLVVVAIIGLLWWGTFTLTPQTEKATTQVGKALVEVEEGVGTLKQHLVSTTESVEAIRVAASTAGEQPNTPATKAEAERLRGNLLSHIERTDVMSELLPPVAEALDKAAALAEQSGDKPRAERLRVIVGSIREAVKELESLRAHVAAIRQGESTPTAKEVAALAQRARKPLDRITTALSDVKQESENLRGELPEVRRAINKWIYVGAAIVTAILLWIGLGQLAIISWGRRRLASPIAIAPQATTPAK